MRYSDLVKRDGRDIFVKYGQKKFYPAGSILLERGQPINSVIFISKGQVRTFCSNSSGDEVTIFYVDMNSLVGLESTISHETAIVSIAAVTDVELYTLEADSFLKYWIEAGYSIKELLEHFVRRIILLSDYLCCTHFTGNEARLAYFLHSVYTDTQRPILLTHEQIAAVTSMSSVSVTRILKTFENDEAIVCKYKKIRVTNAEKLQKYFNTLGYLID